MKAELIERIRDYLLVLFGFTTQLIGFGLLIHALIGPTPNWRMGSSFLRLQSLSTEEVPVSNLYLGPMVSVTFAVDSRSTFLICKQTVREHA